MSQRSRCAPCLPIDFFILAAIHRIMMTINIKRLSPEVPLPEYKTPGACAFDLAVNEEGTLAPGERRLFHTGLVIEVPESHVLLLFPRSSNAKKGISFANGVGVIDRDYCGPQDELKIFLHNIGDQAYNVVKGEYLAQGLIIPAPLCSFKEPLVWPDTNNRGGFGTTG